MSAIAIAICGCCAIAAVNAVEAESTGQNLRGFGRVEVEGFSRKD